LRPVVSGSLLPLLPNDINSRFWPDIYWRQTRKCETKDHQMTMGPRGDNDDDNKIQQTKSADRISASPPQRERVKMNEPVPYHGLCSPGSPRRVGIGNGSRSRTVSESDKITYIHEDKSSS